RRGQAEPGATRLGELADDLARRVVTARGEGLGEGARLTEAVCEVTVAHGDEQARSGHALLQGLPLVVGEIGSRRHEVSSRLILHSGLRASVSVAIVVRGR